LKWLPRCYFFLLLAGTLVIGIEHLLVPASERVALVSRFAGADYATHQIPEFASRPVLIGAHAIGGILFASIVPLQLWRKFRQRQRRVHRWSGWTFILACWFTAVTGVMVAYAYPFAGRAGVIPNLVSAVCLIWFTLAAVSSARRRDFAAHERWVLRTVAIGFGIALARVLLPILVQWFGLDARQALGQVFWLGSGLNLLLMEAWLRRRATSSATPARRGRLEAPAVALQR
jgi:uncharacterized membrane protein